MTFLLVALGAGVAVAVELLHKPAERGRVTQQEVERPGQPGGRRLVAGEQEGDELIAHLGVLHRSTVGEAGLHEQ